ncbi:UvrD-helicase domain-containing protein [Methylosinus trichosporium]|uniref:UvrD-helicase domain-containing protein n=1 Tax=Methylosinus trichosporium TaxID=426 RepID=UPI0024BBC02E|nr:UvrD-helicase domain-containing protein [Methylosinus trichosporium]
MEFRIADTFTDSLARLPAPDQKAVKTSAFDLQTNPQNPGLQLHRIENSKDRNFWSVRVNRDIRIIVHKTEASMLLAYVDHHDRAYAWAERRRIEAHPKTGAVQIVEAPERRELPLFTPRESAGAPPFAKLSDDELLSIGAPADWLADIRAASEDGFLELAPRLPAEAAEALLQYATTGLLARLAPAPADPYAHPDALRRFRVVENIEELAQALDAPWDKWAVFLHPSQRDLVERNYSGPAHVAGSAGTGKSVVAVHRAVRLARASVQARVLLATFSDPLAAALERKVRLLAGADSGLLSRILVASLPVIAAELFELAYGHRPHVATPDRLARALEKATDAAEGPVNANFLRSEWTHVVDAWQVEDCAAYLAVPRLGRKNRLGSKQRERLWPIFAAARESLETRGFTTWPGVFSTVTRHYAERTEKPFTHVVIDEAQDLGVPELRFVAAVANASENGLFFAGDLGQRIFQRPFSWGALGVDIRGRSSCLKVNYRTSHQIRRAADRLLPKEIRDVDGVAEARGGTVSVFNGAEPRVLVAPDAAAEIDAVAAFLMEALASGVDASEIGVFTRRPEELSRAQATVAAAGREPMELSERGDEAGVRISIGGVHLAKGLEFKAVAAMACDEEILPVQSRIDSVADEVELEGVYETERQPFYVAATRAGSAADQRRGAGLGIPAGFYMIITTPDPLGPTTA